MAPIPRLAVALAVAGVVVSGCTNDASPNPGAASPASSPSPTMSSEVLTARERAAQLAALAPSVFDATYRLDSVGNRPDATVRMRTAKERFRLDVERGSSTAVLITNQRGVISCQVEEQGKHRPKRRSCFLVAKKPASVPPLFDPQVQRLFRSTTTQISKLHSDVAVERSPDWKAPGDLGIAECFDVHGRDVTNGTYCYLAKPGPRIGLLARVVLPSGSLNLRSAKQVVRPESFIAPSKPTPLPG